MLKNRESQDSRCRSQDSRCREDSSQICETDPQRAERGAAREKERAEPIQKLYSQQFTIFFKLISNSPTCCSYQYRSSCSVGCLSDFPAPLVPSAACVFSHNFNNTTVIIPPITAPNIAPFQNSSDGNIFWPVQIKHKSHCTHLSAS